MFKKTKEIINSYENKLYLLVFLFLIVAFFDLIGISILLKLMSLIMDYSADNFIVLFIQQTIGSNEKSFVIIIFAIFLIFFSILKNIIKFITLKFQFSIVKELHFYISTKISKSYLRSSFEEFSKYNPQELVKNSVDSVNVFITFIVIGGLNLISNSLIAIVLLTFLFYKSFFMTISVLALIMSINYLFIKLSKKSSRSLQQARENIIAKMYDAIANIIYNKLEIYSYNKEDYFNQSYSKQVVNFNDNRYKFNIINSLPQIYSDFLLYFSVSIIVIILFGFAANTNNAIELLLLYTLVMIRIVPVSSSIVSSYNNIKYYSDSINIVYKMINLNEIDEFRKIEQNLNSIVMTDLNISYGNVEILKDINLKIDKNTKVAFIGSSGTGKTSLVKSIVGSLAPKNGNIQMFSSSISYVTQEPYFFDGTILDNILFGELNVDDIKLNKILKQCLLDKFIINLPNGVNTNIGHRASLLSGGQKQRLALARALYFESDIIILDEVTSALDNKSEYEIRQVIDNMENITIIMVAHRLSSIKNFDNIILLQDKKILDQGNYIELLTTSEEFRKLVAKGNE